MFSFNWIWDPYKESILSLFKASVKGIRRFIFGIEGLLGVHMERGVLGSRASIIRRRQWHPTPVLLPGKSHGRRNLVGWGPWGREESDTTEWLHFHFSLSCIREGNGNPLQCSCLENPRDSGAWWASVYGVAQSRTQLKQLSSFHNRDM